jgi:hypothetical protein
MRLVGRAEATLFIELSKTALHIFKIVAVELAEPRRQTTNGQGVWRSAGRSAPLQPRSLHGRAQASHRRQARSQAHQHVVCRALKSFDANGQPAHDALHECLFEEGREPRAYDVNPFHALRADVSAFMREKKSFLPRVVEGAKILGKSRDGANFIVAHNPCPKFRVIIPLSEPWRANNYKNQAEANAAWREFVAALASTLGLQADQSCSDTSRLFYFPRTRPNGPEFQFAHIHGEPCDLHATVEAAQTEGLFSSGSAQASYKEPPAAWLLRWAASHAARFEIIAALKARSPGKSRRANGVKQVLECPFEGEHTAPGGEGAFAVNASQLASAGLPQINTGFVLKCSHNACAGRDRLAILSGMLTQGWLAESDLTDPEFLSGGSGSAADARLEWPEPKPLPGGLLPVAPFDPAFLPEAVAPWVMDISDRMQCPPDFVAIPAMVALGSVIGRKVAVRPQRKTDWYEVADLWGCIVGRPGAMKSPAMDEALKPLHRLEAEARKANEAAAKDYTIEVETFKLRKEDGQKKGRAALKGGAGDISSLLATDEPEEPKARRYVVTDATYEALGVILADNPNGTLAFRDELILLLKHLDREEQVSARGFFLTAWNGTSGYTFDRIIRGKTHIEAACLSLLGSTQPGRLTEYMRGALTGGAGDDGMVQRFSLLVWPDQSPSWENMDCYPASEPRAAAWQAYRRLDELTADAAGAASDEFAPVPYLRFDKDAQGVFDEWRKDFESRLRSDDLAPALESHLAKYRKLIPALALINHLADGGTGAISETATLRVLASTSKLMRAVLMARVQRSKHPPRRRSWRRSAKAILPTVSRRVTSINMDGRTSRTASTCKLGSICLAILIGSRRRRSKREGGRALSFP